MARKASSANAIEKPVRETGISGLNPTSQVRRRHRRWPQLGAYATPIFSKSFLRGRDFADFASRKGVK